MTAVAALVERGYRFARVQETRIGLLGSPINDG
jgi:hypothetical protein